MTQAHEVQRFVFLDGLRGVAALAVAVLHASQIFALPGVSVGAALAVDFFFCLSGFVVAHAYDGRLRQGMRLGAFMRLRLIRLYPMIVAGVALGALSAVYVGVRKPVEIAVLSGSALGFIPLGLVRGDLAYLINPPMWSLVFELFACLAYAIGTRMFEPRLAAWLLVPAGLLLCAVIWVAGGVTDIGYVRVVPFLAGFVRVSYPFLAGVLAYRWGLYRRVPALPGGWIALALLAFLLAPTAFPALRDIAAVILVLPTVVVFGAATAVKRAGIWEILGRLSYPFYLVHYPILKAVAHFRLGTALPGPVLAAVGILMAAAVAQGALIFYDIPVRQWLGGRFRPKA